jgi:hypothetical protein
VNSFSVKKLAYFGIGLGLLAACVFWCLVGFVFFIQLALSRDSVPGASVFDRYFVTFYVVWGSVFFVIVWFGFKCFKRSLGRDQKFMGNQPSASVNAGGPQR